MKPKNHNVIFPFPNSIIKEFREQYRKELKGHTDQEIARILVLDFYNVEMFDVSHYGYNDIRKLFALDDF